MRVMLVLNFSLFYLWRKPPPLNFLEGIFLLFFKEGVDISASDLYKPY